MHIALIGDSIFDNKAYVKEAEPDIHGQLAALLPVGHQATLLAVDGDKLIHIPAQLQRLPNSATHLVISIGGNDVLGYLGLLSLSANSITHALMQMSAIRLEFKRNYETMLKHLLAIGKPTLLCTMYYPHYSDDSFQDIAVTALAIFNDVVITAAIERGLPLLDLRLVCSDSADYANPIEPSAIGGAKIAAAIWKALQTHEFTIGRPCTYR